MRDYPKGSLAVLVVLAFTAACSERPSEPQALTTPALAIGASGVGSGGNAVCPIPADIVVTNEAGLLAALSAANPGDVIGLDGLIEVAVEVNVSTENVTLTCATPGSGLVAGPGIGWPLLTVGPPAAGPPPAGSDGITIDHLVLDATNIDPPWGRQVVIRSSRDMRFSNNVVICGPARGPCVKFSHTPGALITGNTVAVAATDPVVKIGGHTRGIQVQGVRDGVRVERNRVFLTSPRAVFGIRIAGGPSYPETERVTVAHNVVEGNFSVFLSLVGGFQKSTFADNHLNGPRCPDSHSGFGAPCDHGVLVQGVFGPFNGNVIRNNVVRGPFLTGVALVSGACGNTLVGNNLQLSGDAVGVVFDPQAGANTLVGNKNVVVDNGDFDCDGDAVADPNIITGSGAVLNGVNLGEIVSAVLRPDCEELPDGSKSCEW
jgi:hypothetical protein